ncbi:DUF4412 domain-containing protein [Aquiflexum lacus]|uniref:DUF4412 domain-containing protein n=1 Tax=Aquiflexum lacus TaxID=2483805 RepID=UPI001894FFCF|nr:DUF4412 domain-containing protein [Aquiflexum lacus]
MKTTIKLLLLIIFLIISVDSHAQFAKQLKKAAERGVSRAIERKVESEMEKLAMRQLNKVFKDVYGTEDVERIPGMDIGKIMESIQNDVEVDESYDFTGYSILEITGIDEKGKSIDPVVLKSYLSENSSITGMEFSEKDKNDTETYVMIFDFNRNISITLFENDGQKMRMAFGYDYAAMSQAVDKEGTIEEGSDLNASFKKTGNSKNIMGHDCEEYLIETDENITNYWVTKSPITGQASFWGQNNPFLTARMKEHNPDLFDNLPSGNMMEAYMESKKDKSKMEMKVIDLKENQPKSFLMAEYPGMANFEN